METSGQLYKEPYRATKLWLSCVELFRSGIPLSKHRRQWKTFENSFLASEAITWFNTQLQDNFQLSITRKQTHQLLQKFYKAGIFVEASNRTAGGGASPPRDEVDFKDNVKLYRLTDQTPAAAGTANTSASKENEPKPKPQTNYTVVIKPLSADEIHRIWEQTFTERFIQVVGYDVYSSFLKPGSVHGHWISHNMTKIGQYGIVMNTNGAEEIPPWIIEAMKCLARWPNSHTLDSSTPSYPGFENDVFKLIREYFSVYKNVSPLLTHDLYDAFITTFIRAELFDFNTRVYGVDNSFVRKPSYNGRRAIREEAYPFNASESVENLIMEMLTPSNIRNKTKIQIQPKRIFGEVKENEESFSVPKPMPAQAYTLSRYVPQRYAKESPFFYETAFTTDKSPITRVVSKTELESSLGTFPRVLRENSDVNVNANNLKNRFAYENPTLTLSPSDMINHPKYNRIRKSTLLGKPEVQDLPSYSFMEMSPPKPKTSATTNSCTDFNIGREFGPIRKPERSRSAADLSDCVRDRSPYVPDNPSTRPLPRGLTSRYANSPSRSVRRTLDFYYGAEACVPGLMTTEGKELAIASFRLLTLLLPAKNRRQLQLLIRCMTMMSKNEKLMLDVAMTTRALVINTFYRCILCCADRTEFDELLALRIVTFLMDNDNAIFDVAVEEKNIVKRAEERISQLQIVKIPADTVTEPTNASNGQVNNEEPKFACNRITMDEYEDQRLLASTSKSLRDLLDAFDQSTDEKERKKRLREFREEYPHIFYEKYGDSEPLNTSGTKPAEKKKPFRLFNFRF